MYIYRNSCLKIKQGFKKIDCWQIYTDVAVFSKRDVSEYAPNNSAEIMFLNGKIKGVEQTSHLKCVQINVLMWTVL